MSVYYINVCMYLNTLNETVKEIHKKQNVGG